MNILNMYDKLQFYSIKERGMVCGRQRGRKEGKKPWDE